MSAVEQSSAISRSVRVRLLLVGGIWYSHLSRKSFQTWSGTLFIHLKGCNPFDVTFVKLEGKPILVMDEEIVKFIFVSM